MDILIESLIAPIRTEALDLFFYTSTTIGGEYAAFFILPLFALIAYGCRHCRPQALTVLIAVIGAECSKQFIKHIVWRDRPFPISIAEGIEHDSSFPSGHATFAVACYGTITYLPVSYTHLTLPTM
jgi:membrane-associated phospholipid phosphatase